MTDNPEQCGINELYRCVGGDFVWPCVKQKGHKGDHSHWGSWIQCDCRRYHFCDVYTNMPVYTHCECGDKFKVPIPTLRGLALAAANPASNAFWNSNTSKVTWPTTRKQWLEEQDEYGNYPPWPKGK